MKEFNIIFTIMKPLLKFYTAIIIVFIILSLTACNVESPYSYSIQSICEQSCSKYMRFNCLDWELEKICVPTCLYATKMGSYDPTCSAFANNKYQMMECNIKCQ